MMGKPIVYVGIFSMTTQNLFEYPLNERMRVFMRLDSLFLEIKHYLQGQEQWDSQASIMTLIEIVNILERNDLRTELLKELDRNLNNLNRLLSSPTVNTTTLNNTIDKLTARIKSIQSITGKVTKSLRQDDLLNSIRQRAAISSSICSFDIPGFYHWLQQPANIRQSRISSWLNNFKIIQDSIHLLLNLLRESSIFETKTAEKGFYQKTLDFQQSCQIVRILAPIDNTTFPEISGGKHRINVRFLHYENDSKRPQQYNQNITFDLCCCVI
jgi:cell division protein ZapD